MPPRIPERVEDMPGGPGSKEPPIRPPGRREEPPAKPPDQRKKPPAGDPEPPRRAPVEEPTDPPEGRSG